MQRNFRTLLEERWSHGNFVCVGLDSDRNKIPGVITMGIGYFGARALTAFNQRIVDATKDIVGAYKPNIAFYEPWGDEGWVALKRTIEYINEVAPDVPIILDAKRADIGNTNKGYASMAFDYLGVDAITVHPYLGREALKPFLDRVDKGIIVLCRTSNPGAGEFQDLEVGVETPSDLFALLNGPARKVPIEKLGGWDPSMPLYQYVAHRVASHWNVNGNCAVVVGATYPKELREVRNIVGDMPILIPGIGAQGGDLEAAVVAGRDSRGYGMIINSSSGIIFASDKPDFAEAARRKTMELNDAINRYR